MNKILVPFDFSKCANHALDFAFEIACHSGGEIRLVHIIDYPTGDAFNTMGEIADLEKMDDVYIVAGVKKLKERLHGIVSNERFNGIEINYHLKFGNPFESIGRQITEFKAYLVVIGTQGSSGFEEVIVGTNTERVVRFSQCPVISVRERVKLPGIKRLLFGIDPDDDQGTALKMFAKYQKIFNAELHLVWVNTPHVIYSEEEIEERMRSLAADAELTNYKCQIHNDINPEGGLLRYAEENDIDLLALTTHSRRGLVHLLSGSTAEDLVNHSRLPVWTYSLTAVPENV